MALTAAAAPLKLAVVYGHNGGTGPRAPLRYAEADAQRVAQTLVEVGGVRPEDLTLITGKPPSALFAALEAVKARVAASKQTVLYVYLSAHADGREGLLPGGERLPWAKLKEAVADTGATVRVTIVDACEAAGLVEAGATATAPFRIEAEDALTVKGEAFITSSALNEPSLEAGAFQGSVFTQHLVAGLRGAADASHDGKVSLAEAYRYAYERTQQGESGQHPGLAVQLKGYGELTVSTLGPKGPGLLLPRGASTVSLRDADSGDRVLSVRDPLAEKLRLSPGRFVVDVERDGVHKGGDLLVKAGGYTRVDEGALSLRSMPSGALVRLEGADEPVCARISAVGRRRDLANLAQRLDTALGLPACQGTPAQVQAEFRAGPTGPEVTISVPSQGWRLIADKKAADGEGWVTSLAASIREVLARPAPPGR